MPEHTDRGYEEVPDLPRIEAQLRFEIGVTLGFLGERWCDARLLKKAVTAFRESAEVLDREGDSFIHAARQRVLGTSLISLGEITGDPEFFEQAAVAFRAALVRSEDAITVGGLVAALFAQTGGDGYARVMGHEIAGLDAARKEDVSGGRAAGTTVEAYERSVTLFAPSGPEQLEGAASVFRKMLEKRTSGGSAGEWAKPNYKVHDDPDFVSTRTTQAHAYTELLKQQVAVLRSALEARARERAPADWAASQNEIGMALGFFGERIGHMKIVEEAMAAFRTALAGLSRVDTPVKWVETQDRLAKALQLLGERKSDAGFLERSVKAYGTILTMHSRERAPLEWALAQFALGTKIRILFERTGNSLLPGQAAAAFRAALQILTREHTPLEWAAAQFNLGTSLCIQHDCDGGAGIDPRSPEDRVDTGHLEEAAAAFRAALEGCTQQGLQELDDDEREAACLAGVKGLVREPMPLYRAETRKRLGNALQTLGALKRETCLLEDAAAAHCGALEDFALPGRERKVENMGKYDLDEARYGLAATLQLLGGRGGETGPLEMAATAYEAIEAIDHGKGWRAGNESRVFPFESTRAGFALGETLLTLFRRKGDIRFLEKANAVYRRTLEVRAREGRASEYGYAPLDWAETQNRFGETLLLMGELRRDGDLLENAAGAYRAALEGFAREHSPLKRAETLNSLGTALLCRDVLMNPDNVIRSGDGWLEDAVGAFRAALDAYSRERLPFRWAAMQCNLGLALERLGRHRRDTGLRDQAVAAFRTAREVELHEQGSVTLAETQYWVTMQHGLGLCLIHMHRGDIMRLFDKAAAQRGAPKPQIRSASPLLYEGAATLRAALERCPPDRLPILWARVHDDLASALLYLGKGRIDADVLEHAAALRLAHEEGQYGERMAALGARVRTALRLARAGHDIVPKPSWCNPDDALSILVSVATDDRFMNPAKTDGVFGWARTSAGHPARFP